VTVIDAIMTTQAQFYGTLGAIPYSVKTLLAPNWPTFMDLASACLFKRLLDFPTIMHYEDKFLDFRTEKIP
jgi:hypothetical protein